MMAANFKSGLLSLLIALGVFSSATGAHSRMLSPGCNSYWHVAVGLKFCPVTRILVSLCLRNYACKSIDAAAKLIGTLLICAFCQCMPEYGFSS